MRQITALLGTSTFCITFACVRLWGYGTDEPCVRPECYPVTVELRGRPAEPRFRPEDNFPHFKEDVRFALGKGANFAGAYTLVEISCGAGCAGVAVVDDRTGRIFRDTPFGEVHFGTPVRPYGKIVYRLSSRLLVIEGSIEGVSKGQVRAYYEWCDPGFRLLKVAPITGP